MRWIAEPDVPTCTPRVFYARTNALTRWLDYCWHLDTLLSSVSWARWVAGRIRAQRLT